MTKLHFNYKDIFRALRLGFSAKKVWMMFLGLFFGVAGYSGITYLAHLVAGSDLLAIWAEYRLLPFPDQLLFPFPWYSWVLYGLGALFFLCAVLITGTAVSKVTYEQLRGDEFYESREAFRFALRHYSSVLASPLLLVGFVALLVAAGLIAGLLSAIPYFGELFVGLVAVPAFLASMFIVYLLVVLLSGLLIGPSIVGATRNDTFDTIFEVFSCVNEQPGRLIWYVAIVAGLSKIGSLLFAIASSVAGRIAYATIRPFAGARLDDIMVNAAFYFKIALPEWSPEPLRQVFTGMADWLGLPQMYTAGQYSSMNWANDIGSVLTGLAFYVVLLLVIAFGCTVWYSGNTLVYAVLAKKKDDKNVLELPEDDEDLLEPVVDVPGKPEPEAPQPESDEK